MVALVTLLLTVSVQYVEWRTSETGYAGIVQNPLSQLVTEGLLTFNLGFQALHPQYAPFYGRTSMRLRVIEERIVFENRYMRRGSKPHFRSHW